MRTLKTKGIRDYADRFAILGIKSRALGIFVGTLRERRLSEALWGLHCYIFFRPSKPTQRVSIANNHAHTAKYINLWGIRCRQESIVTINGVVIGGEYGQPGARILFSGPSGKKVFDPYKSDVNVWHIHSITHVEADLFYVATGDTAKYLDLMRINASECLLIKRVMRKLGGFTASAHVENSQWFGTDFSERPNYLQSFPTNKKYFLPRAAFTEYVISMESLDSRSIDVVTRKLNTSTGHRFTFDVIHKEYSEPKPIQITDHG